MTAPLVLLDELPDAHKLVTQTAVVLATVVCVLFALLRKAEIELLLKGEVSTKDAACELSSSHEPQSNEDVSTYWAKGYGRFKHCGLRPDPINPHQCKPEYSLEALDLPLPALPAEDSAALAELREAVRDLPAAHRTDDSTLLRYLRARKGDPVAAIVYFRSAAQWRDSLGVDRALKDWNLRAYEESLAPWWLSGGVLGLSRQGEPVAWERMGGCHLPRLLQQLSFDDIMKLDIVHCMRSLASLEEYSMRSGLPMGNAILVMDMHGFSKDQVSWSAARAMAQLVDNRNKMMPACISTILCIRAPPAFVAGWNLFNKMLDPGVREKVQVVGRSKDQSINLLRKYIDDDEIPMFLGGRKTINGDPECKQVIAPGGKLPEFARTRFLILKEEEDTGSSVLSTARFHFSEDPPEAKYGRWCCG